jgi:hypothetical protein
MERAATAPKTQKIAKQKIKKARFIVPSVVALEAAAESHRKPTSDDGSVGFLSPGLIGLRMNV